MIKTEYSVKTLSTMSNSEINLSLREKQLSQVLPQNLPRNIQFALSITDKVLHCIGFRISSRTNELPSSNYVLIVPQVFNEGFLYYGNIRDSKSVRFFASKDGNIPFLELDVEYIVENNIRNAIPESTTPLAKEMYQLLIDSHIKDLNSLKQTHDKLSNKIIEICKKLGHFSTKFVMAGSYIKETQIERNDVDFDTLIIFYNLDVKSLSKEEGMLELTCNNKKMSSRDLMSYLHDIIEVAINELNFQYRATIISDTPAINVRFENKFSIDYIPAISNIAPVGEMESAYYISCWNNSLNYFKHAYTACEKHIMDRKQIVKDVCRLFKIIWSKYLNEIKFSSCTIEYLADEPSIKGDIKENSNYIHTNLYSLIWHFTERIKKAEPITHPYDKYDLLKDLSFHQRSIIAEVFNGIMHQMRVIFDTLQHSTNPTPTLRNLILNDSNIAKWDAVKKSWNVGYSKTAPYLTTKVNINTVKII